MSTKHTRENGYYWAYLMGERMISDNYWVIAEYRNLPIPDGAWYIHGRDEAFSEEVFKHIHEVKILHPPLPIYSHVEGKNLN